MTDSLRHPHTLLTLEALCLFGTGLVAGATTYITVVEVPGRAEKTPSYQLENYHEIFPRAAKFMKSFGGVVTIVTAATAILTEKKMWWTPVVLLGALGPFTAIAIAPTNETLMAATDGDKVKEELKQWGKLHNVRTYIALAGFAGAVAAALV